MLCTDGRGSGGGGDRPTGGSSRKLRQTIETVPSGVVCRGGSTAGRSEEMGNTRGHDGGGGRGGENGGMTGQSNGHGRCGG